MVDKNKFKEEDAAGYKLNVYGKGIHVTEAMKNYLSDKLKKIDKLHTHIMDIHVYMEIQRLEHVVTIVAKFEHFKIKVSADSTDIYASIDTAVRRLQHKIRRWKGRIQDHNAKKLTATDVLVNVLNRPYDLIEEINSEIEFENKKNEQYKLPSVIGTEKLRLKTLNMEEAVMKMDLSGDHFLVFRGEEDQKLKVMYRRSDGNYGVIQPE
ncbi:MAG: ribosome-associated translation inhibitor RaiA [Chlamydiales bacterium]|nr:ribosome-associated translation inhibitor RaiA [Chlamydiales bacterium]